MLLSRSPYLTSSRNRLGMMNTGGPDEFYQTYLPPVFGEYQDYGHIGNIEDTPTSRFMKKYFGVSVDKITTLVNNYGRNIYSTSGPIYENYKNSIPSWQDEYNGKFDFYEAIGFTKEADGVYTYENLQITVTEKLFTCKNLESKDANQAKYDRANFSISKHSHSMNKNLMEEFVNHTHKLPGFEKRIGMQSLPFGT